MPSSTFHVRIRVSGTGLVWDYTLAEGQSIDLGRAPPCDLVLGDQAVSRRHASLRVHRGRLVVEDLKSRNGTFVDERGVTDPIALDGKHRLRLGNRLNLELDVRLGGSRSIPTRPVWALEAVQGGVRTRIGQELRIGTGDECTIHLPSGPLTAAVLHVQADGNEVWLGQDDDMRELELDEVFDVEGHAFRLVQAIQDGGATITTLAPEGTTWPYRIETTMQATGPDAVVEDMRSGQRHRLRGANRAVLLYLLAKGWTADKGLGAVPEQLGWVDDEELVVGVWGRRGRPQQLKVLLCRVRGELREAGFDPWFIERRRGQTRVRIEDTQITE